MPGRLSGTYFESCSCKSACPCVFLSPPTTGECTALVGWHIDQGERDGVSFDGVNVALAVHSRGHMAMTPWRAAMYFDDRCSEEQQAALGAIFSGSDGGHPDVLASHIGEILGVAVVPISFDGDAASRAMHVGEVADVKFMALADQGGEQVTIANHPLAVAPGQSLVAARSEHLRYTDHGYQWKLSEKSGFFSPFAYNG